MGLTGYVIATRATLGSVLSVEVLAILPYLPLMLFVFLGVIYAGKCVRFPREVREEFYHPVKLSFFPTVSISFLLLSIAFAGTHLAASKWMGGIGAVLQLVFTVVILGMWIEHKHFAVEHMNPSWFIPIVGNIIVPIAALPHFPMEVSWFFFSIGVVFWLQLSALLLYRKIFHQAIAERLAPTFFILIAPPALGFIAYTGMMKQMDPLAHILFSFAVFTTLLVFYLARKFLRIRFYLSFWAYSFPLAAITIASARYYHMTGHEYALWLQWMLYSLLTVIILGLLVMTGIAVKRRQICTPEH